MQHAAPLDAVSSWSAMSSIHTCSRVCDDTCISHAKQWVELQRMRLCYWLIGIFQLHINPIGTVVTSQKLHMGVSLSPPSPSLHKYIYINTYTCHVYTIFVFTDLIRFNSLNLML